ncbi:MAG: rRNA ((1402)-2-O)-methyltransferase [Frankiales bacterium]|nr:rRNA ((1402)-2-O)-methyltransferase [Frankiales bacterium]
MREDAGVSANPLGLLVLAGTPIGSMDDASPRLIAELARADVIAAEDTRRFRRLTSTLGVTITARVVSYYDATEAARTPELLDAIRAGQRVVLVTDAGMPLVSDPGYRLVAAAAAEGLAVTVAPGPSAVIAALAVSGLPADRFCFEGFLPRKHGERRSRLAELAAERRTLVFFEAPHRLGATLADLASVFGADRAAAVCRELTKTYEEVRRAGLGELAVWASGEVRGEITLVVAGAPERVVSTEPADLAAAVASYEETGLSRKEAIAAVVAETGAGRRAVFDAVVAAKPGRTPATGAETRP